MEVFQKNFEHSRKFQNILENSRSSRIFKDIGREFIQNIRQKFRNFQSIDKFQNKLEHPGTTE